MKKIWVLFLLVFAGMVFTSCGSAPPPAEDEGPEPVPTAPDPAPPSVPAPAPVINTDPPILGVRLSPRYFSPDEDGADDSLAVTLSCQSVSDISEWSFEILEPQPPHLSFFRWNGTGRPPASLIWDGKSASAELVQSASDYPFVFTVKNIHGNASEFKGIIEVDVLVMREGDALRVQVPSIYFASYSGNFTGLSPDISAVNDYILRRIAVVLNKFNTYQVRIEGHANYTVDTPPDAKQKEQEEELQPLSEQRAETVLNYLTSLGVDRNRLSFFGIGGARPVVPFADKNNWWKNRRVEFILVR